MVTLQAILAVATLPSVFSMYELPPDLNNSLRSWRGNGYEERQRDDGRRDAQDVDLEKGVEDYGEKQYDGAPQASSSFTSVSA